ncbi:MAG: hypothetical protein A3J06_04735 [Candidatus Moranbacteria bacterium RIFCSPLOWO2_02_FULL_48_19]|nr:MAG: hypothetical protein A3J06_04735 [Candidatus Moranbacteria bacterium RIFCSPLOWO2_02_FULL_48_19]OGI30107.1 MAG: hypothetical protein A3G09_04740 [Candidatus Moranbacteria bacterium RIFCSPLOWO2_12_FULL_48_12]
MKTLLNLLPEENKKSVQRKLHFRFFLWQLFLVCTLEVFYLSILMSIYLILDFQLQSLRAIEQQYDAAYTEQRTLDAYQKKFKDTNVAVAMVGRIEREHLSFAGVFLLLDTLLPEGIAVDRLTTKNYTVMLSGRAAARDDILALEASLKEAACVKNVNVPISNFFSQKNIDFQIDFEMQKECLQNNTL